MGLATRDVMPKACRHILIAALLVASPLAAQTNVADLAERGFQALQTGDGDTAARLFRQALAVQPRDPGLLFGAGVAAHLQGRDHDASASLKQALQIQPRLTQASELLGEIVHSEGELDLAIKTYEAALKYAPSNMDMRERLEMWRREANVHSGLESLKDGRFALMFQGPVEEKLALRARTVLDSAFVQISRALGASPSNSINVILYTDKQFRDITGAPEWSGGGFDGQIRLPVRGASQNLQLFDRVLIHELTHAMVHGISARNVPAWLHEGLAQYFEGHDAALAARRLAAVRIFVPLALLESSFSRLNAAQAAVAYEESAVAAKALVDRLGVNGVGMLVQALDSSPFDRALEGQGLTLAEFEASVAKRVGVTLHAPQRR